MLPTRSEAEVTCFCFPFKAGTGEGQRLKQKVLFYADTQQPGLFNLSNHLPTYREDDDIAKFLLEQLSPHLLFGCEKFNVRIYKEAITRFTAMAGHLSISDGM